MNLSARPKTDTRRAKTAGPRSQRRRIAPLAVLIVFSGGLAIPAAPAAAAVPGKMVLSFNMWGHSGGSSKPFNSSVASALQASIANRSPQPTVVALQEICNTHLGTGLWTYMASQGYHLAAILPLYVSPACPKFGTVVFAKGTNLNGQSVLDLPGTNGWMACANVGTGLLPLAACSVHLSNDPLSEAVGQLVTMKRHADNLQAFGLVIWAGDFNMHSNANVCDNGSRKYSSWILHPYSQYAEASSDTGPPSPTMTWSTKKPNRTCHFDYIWYQRNIWKASSVRVTTSPYSDHKIYEGNPFPR